MAFRLCFRAIAWTHRKDGTNTPADRDRRLQHRLRYFHENLKQLEETKCGCRLEENRSRLLRLQENLDRLAKTRCVCRLQQNLDRLETRGVFREFVCYRTNGYMA